MKYVFNRNGKEIRSWNEITEAMEKNLEDMHNETVSPEEVEAFFRQASHDASVNEEREMAFWGYDDPGRMPSDARCEYIYRPTYLMTLTLIECIIKYPNQMKKPWIRELMHRALNACAGRNLRGSGYEDYEVLCENLLQFTKHGIIRFMRSWPLFSINFEEVYRNAMNEIERDERACRHTDEKEKGSNDDIRKEIIRLRYAENAPIL